MWLFLLLSGIILLIAGIAFLCSGVVSLAIFGAGPLALTEFVPGASQEVFAIPALFGAGFSAIFILVGLAMTVGGGALAYFGIRSRRKLKARQERILQYGVETEATITFVDRNYGMLVNNRPIYSIVEYTFLDRMERQQTGRINNASSDYVIRNKLEVGSTIRIKYLPDDPTMSLMLEA